MKKIIVSSLIVLTLTSLKCFAAEDAFQDVYNLDRMYDKFYESPIPIPDAETVQPKRVQNISSEAKYHPMFKRIRIKITNFFRAKDNAYQEKMLKQQIAELEQEDDDFEKLEEGLVLVSDKSTPKTASEKENAEAVSESTENTVELTGGVKKQKAENDVVLDCDNVVYDEVKDEIEAIGSPVLTFPPQQVSLKADKMTYNKSSNILKAYGNVELIRDNTTVYGDYVQINLNEENAFMDNVSFKQTNFVVNARKASAENDKIVFEDGKMTSQGSYKLELETRMIGGQDFSRMLVDEEDRSYLSDTVGEVPFKVTAEDVIVEGKKDHDTVTLKKGTVFYGDKKLFNFKHFTAHTDKEHSYFEANYPELGSRYRLGMYIGPGFVFDMPNGAVVKAIPFLNYKSGIGVGGALKYRSANNTTDIMYGSAEDIFIVKGKQRLDDKLYFQYGVNSYMEEEFMGRNMAKYAAELYYKDSTIVRDTIAKDLDLRFTHKAGIGYMHNTDFNKYFGNLAPNDIGTTRFKYMAELQQSLFKRENKEEQKMFDFGVALQGSAAVYGTGDTQFIGRVGPRLHTQYKRWMQDVGFYISAFDDNTPLTYFDTYRYGRSSVYIREALRVNKYLAVGWSSTVTLSNDAPNDKMFQENAFIVAIGPDDFKINLGYDFLRQQTYFSFNIAMDMKGSELEYKKMEIKNPDRIAKVENKTEKLIPTFEEAQRAKLEKPADKKLQYAEVVDIEDPDREQL